MLDFGFDAYEIFLRSPDEVKDVAEDITREVLDRLAGFNISQLLTKPDDVVLDCFVGSGTTAVAAILEGRKYIGIDISEKYVQMSKKACVRAVESLNGKKQLELL